MDNMSFASYVHQKNKNLRPFSCRRHPNPPTIFRSNAWKHQAPGHAMGSVTKEGPEGTGTHQCFPPKTRQNHHFALYKVVI